MDVLGKRPSSASSVLNPNASHTATSSAYPPTRARGVKLASLMVGAVDLHVVVEVVQAIRLATALVVVLEVLVVMVAVLVALATTI